MLQKCSVWKIADVFFDDPEKEFSLADIRRQSSLAHTSIMLHLITLQKEDIIVKINKRLGKRIYPCYKANLNNETYKHYKILSMIDNIKKSDLISYVRDSCMPDCIILFGSSVRGEDVKESDIDIFVQSKEKLLDLKKYENFLRRKIQLHFRENFNKYPKELKNNIINGIKLQGYLEVF